MWASFVGAVQALASRVFAAGRGVVRDLDARGWLWGVVLGLVGTVAVLLALCSRAG